MKKTLALTSMVLMFTMIAVCAMPVLAAPSDDKKVEFSILSIPTTWANLNTKFATGQNPYYPAYFDGIRYFEPGHIMLVGPTGIPPASFETMQVWNTGYYTCTITIDGVPHFGVSCNTQHLEYNAKTKNMVGQCEAVWFIGDMGDVSNGFAGRVSTHYYNYDLVTKTYDLRVMNADLKGFGIYEGQKLHVTYEGNALSPQEWTGYILTP